MRMHVQWLNFHFLFFLFFKRRVTFSCNWFQIVNQAYGNKKCLAWDIERNEEPDGIAEINEITCCFVWVLKFQNCWKKLHEMARCSHNILQSGAEIRSGDGPPKKFEVGGRPMHWPPNILRSSVVGWARKLEQSKKNRCRQGILFWNSAFSCEERVIYDILHSKDTENLKRESKNQKNLVDD